MEISGEDGQKDMEIRGKTDKRLWKLGGKTDKRSWKLGGEGQEVRKLGGGEEQIYIENRKGFGSKREGKGKEISESSHWLKTYKKICFCLLKNKAASDELYFLLQLEYLKFTCTTLRAKYQHYIAPH